LLRRTGQPEHPLLKGVGRHSPKLETGECKTRLLQAFPDAIFSLSRARLS
jgi:hypothetical protein